MATAVPLRQTEINTALRVGKVTCALLSNRIAVGYFNGDGDNKDLSSDLSKVWGWVDALNEVYEVDDSAVYEWNNYLTEAFAKKVIERINRIARKHLPRLIIDKILENPIILS